MIKNITRISFKREPKSISSIIEYYAAGSSKTDVPSEWSTVVPELTSETPYLWNYERVLYSDGSVYDSPPSVRGVYGKGIQSIVDKYLATSLSSGVTRSTSGWTTGIQNTTSIKKYLWNYETIVYNDDTEDYVEPHIIGTYGDKGDDGQSSFKSIVFKRSGETPSTPTGGSYSSPVPSGWSDAVPVGDAQLWMCTRIFTSDGKAPQQSSWTTPAAATDTADIDFEYSADTTPGTPESKPSAWHNQATADDIWIAVRKCKNGVWGDWSVTKFKGEKGDDGQSSFKSIVFKRSGETPSTPTGGSYSSPVPSGWSDAVPVGDAQLWMCTRIFTSDGKAPQQSSWTTPAAATDTADIDFEYSADTTPGTPESKPSAWHNQATADDIWIAVRKCKNGVWGDWSVTKFKGEKGDDGISMVPLYRNSDIAPAKPTGDILPPDGWRTDPENNVAVEIEINSELSDHAYDLTTENYEYETPYHVLATENVSFAEEEDADGKLCIAAKVKLTTSMQNQQVQIEVISSSESNYDCGFIGLLDNNTIPSRFNADTYKTKVSGKEVTAVAMIDIPAAGDHFVNIFYIKDNTRSEYDDKIWFRIKPLPQTMWMSIAQVKNEAVQSYTTPIAITAARGPQGARTNVTTYKANTLYYAGNFGEPVLDIVFYNGRYYRCIKTHISAEDLSMENPYDEVMHGYNTWSLESNQEFIATKVLFAGDGDNGWIMEDGIIRHTSGKVSLAADGSIVASNGYFKLDADGNIEANSGTFAGYLRIPFKSLSQHTVMKNSKYWLSDTFNLVNDAALGDNELVLPDDISFSGAVVTISSFRLSKMDGGVIISTESTNNLYSANCLQTTDDTFPRAFSQLVCDGFGVIQLLAVPKGSGANKCTWIVINEAATGLSYL